MDIVLWSHLSSAVETSLPTDGLVPADPAGHPKGLWIAPVRFLELIDGWSLAQWACALARAWRNRLHPALPSGRHPGGAPPTDRDEGASFGSLLTMLVLRAWYRQDPDADLAGRRRGPPTDGYKIPALVDRWTHLPLLFVLTPARWHEVTIAPFLLVTAIVLYGLRSSALYADSADSPHRFVTFGRALGVIPIIDDQLRRLGKRLLATLFFLDQWRRLRAPRTAAERCFAFLKRYDGLTYVQVTGWEAVWRSALLIHTAMLAVAVIAYRLNRPDLMTSRAHVLAFVTN
jgi:hypothetical protein